MISQYLAVIWQWVSTVLMKTLAVWLVVTLLAIIWVRLGKIHPDDTHLASAKRQAILSLLIMIALFPLPFALNPLIDAVDDAPLLVKLLVTSGCQLLLCIPIIVVLAIRHQRLETAGISGKNLPMLLALGVVLAITTAILFAAISALDKNTTPTQVEPLTSQRCLYLIAALAISAIAHEFIYRGYLQTRLAAWGGSAKGLLASSLIYSLWHLPRFLGTYNWITMLVQFVALFVLGLALGEVRRRTGSIIPSILFHAGNDVAQTLW